jgi:hypothetical protein
VWYRSPSRPPLTRHGERLIDLKLAGDKLGKKDPCVRRA